MREAQLHASTLHVGSLGPLHIPPACCLPALTFVQAILQSYPCLPACLPAYLPAPFLPALPGCPPALPPSCSFAVHNKGFSYYYARDQTPTIAVYLLNLVASGMVERHEPLLETCRKQTGMAVCKLYKDPFQVWVRCTEAGYNAVDRVVVGYRATSGLCMTFVHDGCVSAVQGPLPIFGKVQSLGGCRQGDTTQWR
jgi:hypothetical protein